MNQGIFILVKYLTWFVSHTLIQYGSIQLTSQQLYVFGEVLEPNQDTVNLVEEIVREQVVEIVSGYGSYCHH
jgi:hypothetical protein